MLFNRYARQQRLNPAEQQDPAMRSMMDAVRQVYETKEEVVEVEELLTEGVPGNIMGMYEKFLGGKDGTFEKGAPKAVQSLHMKLLLRWYTLDFHFEDNRPWKATKKGIAIGEKVLKDLQKNSSMRASLTNAIINDSDKHHGDVWNSIFANEDNQESWGVPKGSVLDDDQWSGKWTDRQNMDIFEVNRFNNPYGDLLAEPLRGKGFYLKTFMQKKFIEKAIPKKDQK